MFLFNYVFALTPIIRGMQFNVKIVQFNVETILFAFRCFIIRDNLDIKISCDR